VGIADLVPRLRNQGYESDRVARRRLWVEQRTGAVLKHVGSYSIDSEEMRGNIENPVGAAQIPLGIAGPLQIHGSHAQGTFYVPLATTEGALVRSYERGMVALPRAGGVEASLLGDENQISPSFFCETVREASRFTAWLSDKFEELRTQAESTTRHGRLNSVRCHQFGRQVIANFGFHTGDAQGMNMIVKATDRACRWVV
jgi:hydroxymethylglutaryl-CoA reductase (NADPH)